MLKKLKRPTQRRMALLALLPAALLLLGMDASAQGASAPLKLVTAPYPPFVNEKDSPEGEGMDIEIAREALRRGGYDIEVIFVPWKRALLMLERGEADLTTSISRSDERDRYLAWSQGYRNATNYRFYAAAGSPLKLTTLDGLDGHRLGVAVGFVYPDAIGKRPGVTYEPGSTIATMAMMLSKGRTDYMVVNGLAGAWEVKHLGLDAELVLQPFIYARDSSTFMAFSLARPYPLPLDAMNKGLASMVRDGTLARIEKKYTPPQGAAQPGQGKTRGAGG